MDVFFSCNFPAKTFANVLFFVRAAYFAGTTNPTSSFKACALTSAIDGSDDKDIHCFKDKQPCHAGLEVLAEQIELATGQEENPFQVDPDEITEAAPQELIVDEDKEGDSDIDID